MPSKNKSDVIEIYKKYYIDRDYEQIDLFQLLQQQFDINNAIYPGCYVQISPAFVFSKVVFIDSDKTAKRFFSSNRVVQYIAERKEYRAVPDIAFFAQNYQDSIDGLEGKFDLLISQYAGFISDSCKKYLKLGGYLLVNNSHADAGLAALDGDYQLLAVVNKSSGKYRLSLSKLDEYFIPKKNIMISKDTLYQTGKGVGYTKTAPLYIFQRIA